MSFSTVLSASVQGLEIRFVYVEADTSSGLPMFHMVGYLAAEVKEAGERVRTAIRNTGLNLPARKVVINLAPAEVRKRGASFDLPMAIALLVSLNMVRADRLRETLIIGELSLDGSVRKVPGILPIADAARKKGCRICIVPKPNENEGKLISDIRIIGVNHLQEVCDFLNGKDDLGRSIQNSSDVLRSNEKNNSLDFAEVKGQQLVKRATEVAVAGNHSILYIGPPGSGKTMIARRIPSILPPLTIAESIEITKVYSVLGLVDKTFPLLKDRPFRSVHHTVTKAALIGGGQIPVPGELSLANGGVLFLDELAEFHKSVLEVLRQPMEEKHIQIVRNRGNYIFPANVMLVAAMNPCPCGNYPDYNKCSCTDGQIRQYLTKISQPFLDRIDLCVEAPKVEYQVLNENRPEENSSAIRARVCRARALQRDRYVGGRINTNEQMGKADMETYCCLNSAGSDLMKQAFKKLSLTARSYYKILRVARTIADLDESNTIEIHHLREAIGYRMIDRKYWGR